MRAIMSGRRLSLGSLLLVSLALVVACNDADDSTSDTTAPPSVPVAADQTPSYLFVVDAESGTSEGTTLVLSDVDDRVLRFTDRPFRQVDHLSLEEFVEEWNQGLFASSPPNVAVTWDIDGVTVSTAVEFTDVAYEDGSLSFTFNQLEEADILGDSERVEIPDNLSEVSLVVDSATGFVVRGFEICLVAENPIRSSCATPTDSVLDALNVSGPYPEEEISGAWQNTTFSSGGVLVHEDATWAKTNLVFRCAGTGDPSDAYQSVLDWIQTTYDMDIYGPIPDGEPECGADTSQAWCSGGDYGNVAGNKLQCNWTWSDPPTLPALDTLTSAQVMAQVPEPWPPCPVNVVLNELFLGEQVQDLPGPVCSRANDVINQAFSKAPADNTPVTTTETPSGYAEPWSCDAKKELTETILTDETYRASVSADIACTILGTSTAVTLKSSDTGTFEIDPT